MTTESPRTWKRVEDSKRELTWTSSDGRAVVKVIKVVYGWQVVIYEDGQYIGSEPVSPYRSGAVVVAKKWLKALGRPTE